jgi:hypothetical protein
MKLKTTIGGEKMSSRSLYDLSTILFSVAMFLFSLQLLQILRWRQKGAFYIISTSPAIKLGCGLYLLSFILAIAGLVISLTEIPWSSA